ncbi:MAG: energy transducer TonB [Bacteroidales bacterium]|nr:energy transducer TonB [Bacteroidales bacterium]
MKTQILIAVLSLIAFSVMGQNDTSRRNNDRELMVVVESMPEFVGGFEALKKYIKSKAVYTEQARKDKVTGRVYVSFFVDKNGAVTEPYILRGLHPDLDSISLSIVKNMPNWKPGTQRGKPIGCQFNLPIGFHLDQNQNTVNPAPSNIGKKRKEKIKKDIQQ